MNIAVVGTGYVGLTVAVCLASQGHRLTGCDIDEGKLQRLRGGVIPFYEPGLEELLRKVQARGAITFTADLACATQRSEVIFICVGTPNNGDGSANTQAVHEAAEGIGLAMNGPKVVVIKSTVPVGTADRVWETIARHTSYDFAVVSNPEFLREGHAIHDFLYPERLVVGTDEPWAAQKLKDVFRDVIKKWPCIIMMDRRSAEMTKYASNAFLATRLSFINEIAALCEATGADVENVRQAAGLDPRIGTDYFAPGPGYGGSCLPKDVKALVQLGRCYEVPVRLLESVDWVNTQQPVRLFQKISRHFDGELAEQRIAVWGLAFKPNTDDVRESPSLALIRLLLEAGAQVTAFDPKAIGAAASVLGKQVVYCRDQYEALERAEALVVVTEWEQFLQPDFPRMRQLMRVPVIFDLRNLYDGASLHHLGFTHYRTGRRTWPESVPRGGKRGQEVLETEKGCGEAAVASFDSRRQHHA